MSSSLKVVIVGGVAAGPKVASKVIRLRPDAEVTIVEKGELLSYAGCGLPYYVSGVVQPRYDWPQLISSPAKKSEAMAINPISTAPPLSFRRPARFPRRQSRHADQASNSPPPPAATKVMSSTTWVSR